jgi:hypothetical protein
MQFTIVIIRVVFYELHLPNTHKFFLYSHKSSMLKHTFHTLVHLSDTYIHTLELSCYRTHSNLPYTTKLSSAAVTHTRTFH